MDRVTSRIARFDGFEADLDSRELRKAGAPVRLQEQPFQLLALLLERAGEIVSRDEVRQKLWPSDTFVDFDRSLNTAINKIRDALGDSAEKPRYVQTLPRRGYRFICPLEEGGLNPTGRASTPSVKANDSRRYIRIGVVSGLILLVAFAGVLAVHLSEKPPEAKLVTFIVPAPDKTVIAQAVISPEGSRVAFTAVDQSGMSRVYVRALDSLSFQVLAGTEGAGYPFWSPDAAYIGFRAGTRLYKVAASGGPVQLVCESGNSGGGAWTPDGDILFTRSLDALFRVRASGGVPQPFTRLDVVKKESRHYWPSLLPDGRHFLYVATSTVPEVQGLWVASLRNPNDRHRLLGDVSMAVYSSGHLLFVRDGALVAQAFDLRRLEVNGPAVPIVDHVVSDAIAGWGQFSASTNGVLAVLGAHTFVSLGSLGWFDRHGKSAGKFGAAGRYQAVSLSPEQNRVAVDAKTESGYQLFVLDPERGTTTQVTFGAATGNVPIWSPDGSKLAFTSNRDGFYDVYLKSSTGAGPEELLVQNDANKFVQDWSRDGRYLMYSERRRGNSNTDLWVLSMLGERKPSLYLHSSYEQRDARFSPDGRWVTYASNESSISQVYVQAFPGGSAKVQISIEGGTRPRWRADGKELYYVSLDGQLMAVEVQTGGRFSAARPSPLFKMSRYIEHGYEPAASGHRFVMLAPEDGSSEPLAITLNWPQRTKRHN